MNGLFIGWGESVRGREQKSLEVFNEFVEYLSDLQQRGEIDSFEPVFLEPHGGDLDGFALIRGEPERLARIRASDEWFRLLYRAGLVVDGLGVVGATLGDRLGQEIGRYQEQLRDLG